MGGGQAEAVIIRSVSNGAAPWTVSADFTITHNLIQHVPAGVQMSASDPDFSPAQPTARILVQNNLLMDVSSANWGPSLGYPFFVTSTATYLIHDIILDHNTTFADTRTLELGDSGVVTNFQFTNNIADYGTYGIFGSGIGSGTAALSTFAPSYLYKDVVLMNPSGASQGGYPAGDILDDHCRNRLHKLQRNRP